MNYSFALFYGDVFKFFLKNECLQMDGLRVILFFQKIPKPKTEFLHYVEDSILEFCQSAPKPRTKR